MSTSVQQPAVEIPATIEPQQVMRIYGHSSLVYWWPVWAIGYFLAVLTYLQGVTATIGDSEVLIHPNRGLGVVFTFVFLLVILMTHAIVRGVASLTVLVTMVAVVLFLAYMGWWDPVLRAMGKLSIFMNLGFYVFFSTAVFVTWAAAVFFFDRLEYWEFRPGQAVQVSILGGGAQTFDTRGMVVDKKRDDLFRHWVLGLGSGDIQIMTTGARTAQFTIKNVLFVGRKLEVIQRLAAMKPDDDPRNAAAVPPPT